MRGFDPPADRCRAPTSAIPQHALHPEPDEHTARQIGSRRQPERSTYVIAELDGAFTRYKEFTLEGGVPQGPGVRARARTRCSRYYGNFDQDNSTVDDVERRQHLHRLVEHRRRPRPPAVGHTGSARCAAIVRTRSSCIGSYSLPWHASLGAYLVAQSGQPWEKWDYTLYSALTTSTSETIKYAEAGGHRIARRRTRRST